MSELLWLIPAVPLIGFLALILLGSRLSSPVAASIGTGTVGLSAVSASVLAALFIARPPASHAFTRTLWTWVETDRFSASVSLYLDPLSIVMVLVVTWVSFLILIYSTRFMAGDEGYSRFFAYMDLFVGSMLILVLADNLLLLYLGWEGVGLCSYLLIGFWYRKKENGEAAFKAFVVTRIGDAALIVGLFLIFQNLGTLTIQEAMSRASAQWAQGSAIAIATAALLLGGALGKSAQLPLQTWLPDAMAGPTPVSALIHAATMVTAGVYLIARTHVFFSLAPAVQHVTALIGAATLLIAASSALVQRDIKRVLAYSTMSQVGYMFLALGAGAWIAAIFHFVVHAFFKTLLFLCAGVVIKSLADEHDIFKMGGLRRDLPLVFLACLVGCASLSGVPFVTAGFYSKELILTHVWYSPFGGLPLFIVGLAGGLLTSLYSFRLLFIVFCGDRGMGMEKMRSPAMTMPLVVLLVAALAGGFLELPGGTGKAGPFSDFMGKGLPALAAAAGRTDAVVLLILSSIVSLGGILLASMLFRGKRLFVDMLGVTPIGRPLHRFLFSGWAFDRLYGDLLVKPVVFLARLNRNDFLDLIYRAMAEVCRIMHAILSFTQSGNIRWYATAIALGAIILMGAALLL